MKLANRVRHHQIARILSASFLTGLIHSTAFAGVLPVFRDSLYFESNQGQAPGVVDFVARGPNYHVFLSDEAAMLAVPLTDREGNQRFTSVGMVLENARRNLAPQGVDKQAFHVNYLKGQSPDTWVTGVSTFHKVAYTGVYDGIDLVYYGNGNRLEYDFILQPSANPADIAIRFDPSFNPRLTPEGRLALSVEGETLYLEKPVIYQPRADRRILVEGAFHIRADGSVGFELGAYDHDAVLVIDPTVTYLTYFGGASTDRDVTVAVDPAGNTYIAGTTQSVSLPGLPGPVTISGENDAFVSKISPDGASVLYTTIIGGSGQDGCFGIAVDAQGRAAIGGQTDSSTDFPLVNAADATYGGGALDAYVAKLNATGNALVFSTFLGGTGAEASRGLAADALGHVYACADDGTRVFVAKYDGNTGAAFYTRLLNSPAFELAGGIAADAQGFAYVTGFTSAIGTFPIVGTPQLSTGTFAASAFLAIYNTAGTLVYSSLFGGQSMDFGWGVDVDDLGYIYLTGFTQYHQNFQPALDLSLVPGVPTGRNGYLIKLAPLAGGVVYAKLIGGNGEDTLYDVDVDALGNAYVIGTVGSTDLPLVDPIRSVPTGMDAYVFKLIPDGSAFEFATYLGGSGYDFGSRGALDPDGNYFGAGYTASTDFDQIQNALQPSHAGDYDGFVFMLQMVQPTCIEQLQEILEMIEELEDQGLINHGQSNALSQQILQAIKFLGKDMDHVAINMLTTFLNKLNGMLSEEELNTPIVQDLIDLVVEIRERIQNGECE